MIATVCGSRSVAMRRAFTLVELLITVSIIGIMAASVLFAMVGATEMAKRKKTEALVARIDATIQNKWDAYLSRRVPVIIPDDERFTDQNNNAKWDSGEPFMDANGNGVYDRYPGAKIRLDALRELMRMELPDRWSDIIQINYTPPSTFTPTVNPAPRVSQLTANPSVWNGYFRRATANPAKLPTLDFQGAECLYMIIESAMQEDGDDASRLIGPDVTGDKDGDGFKEIHDAWGNPIRFLRWAPGFDSPLQAMASGRLSNSNSPDSKTFIFEADITYGTTPVPPGAVISPQLSQVSGAYIGCAAIGRSPGDGRLDFGMVVRITGYEVVPGTPIKGKFTCTTPLGTMMSPGAIASNYNFTIFPRDPFDPAGAYPKYPAGNTFPAGTPKTAFPSMSLYPLVYSAGGDKDYGIVSDTPDTDAGEPLHPLSYSVPAHNVANPFYVPNNGELMGYVSGSGAKDNIHNHMLGLR